MTGFVLLPCERGRVAAGPSAKECLIEGNVTIRHNIHRKLGGDRLPARGAINLPDTTDCIDGFIHAADQKPCHAVIDQLEHGSTLGSDDRCAAGESLDHRQSERFVEVRQMEKCARRTQGLGTSLATQWAAVHDRLAINLWCDLIVIVILILNDACDYQVPSARWAARIASAVPLSGWMRPKKRRSSLPCVSKGKSSSRIP